ncbi:hypothetical protein ES708_15624 [subsurface metagenome]
MALPGFMFLLDFSSPETPVVKSIYPPILPNSIALLNSSSFLFKWVGANCSIGISVFFTISNNGFRPNFSLPI